MVFIKDGIFWRILVNDLYVSKKKFLTERGMIRYYEKTQDRFGIPVVRYKGGKYGKN